MKFIAVLLFSIILSACASGRYKQKHDSAPIRPPTELELQDAQVSHEPVGRGNNPYIVFGKKYQPMKQRKPFNQEGVASWYGKKFHGHLTSNGEVYNMYGMSAAHKTLPLPSYVKVTNLANNKTVVVRVNDRGPFHENRIIDLSYSAAVKIGVFDTGTAKVKVESILPAPLTTKQFQVKISGFTHQDEVQQTGIGLGHMLHLEPELINDSDHKHLFIGPFASVSEAESWQQKVKQFGFPDATVESMPTSQ